MRYSFFSFEAQFFPSLTTEGNLKGKVIHNMQMKSCWMKSLNGF